MLKDTINFALSGSNILCEFSLPDSLWFIKADEGHEQEVALSWGRYVRLAIEDTGSGIPQEIIDKIFDPYFTTKPNGNGLGLATSYSIIKKHNGYITLKSEVGVGTILYIYLPACEYNADEKKQEDELLVHKGRVLVMDDEEQIREVIGAMLCYLGYKPSFAQQARKLCKYLCATRTMNTPLMRLLWT